MKILVGCEESQAVCIALRRLNYEAYSNDIIPCSGDHPEWHLQMDIFEAIKLKKWDMLIAFPPCTYLTVAGNRHIPSNPDRWDKRHEAVKFVWNIMQADIPHIAVENPVGVLSTYIRKPDQIIHPYYFGDPVSKATCLWLKNLPVLTYTPGTSVEPEYIIYRSKKNKSGYSRYSIQGTIPSTNNPENAKLRSKTYPGVAKAMAEQWTEYIKTFTHKTI